jgi:hypothetical protein
MSLLNIQWLSCGDRQAAATVSQPHNDSVLPLGCGVSCKGIQLLGGVNDILFKKILEQGREA